MNFLKQLGLSKIIVPTIPLVVAFIDIVIPHFISRSRRIPNADLIGVICHQRTMNAHPGEIIELEALTINGGEADANSVEVSLREIVGDIADNDRNMITRRVCRRSANTARI